MVRVPCVLLGVTRMAAPVSKSGQPYIEPLLYIVRMVDVRVDVLLTCRVAERVPRPS